MPRPKILRHKRAVLMSIKPKYASLIFSGIKTIELRRVCPKVEAGDLVIVYASGPRMALLGAFLVGGIVKASPSELAAEWATHAGLSKADLIKYFEGKKEGYGILIKAAWQLSEAKELNSLRKIQTGFHPPQSYRYLLPQDLAKFLN